MTETFLDFEARAGGKYDPPAELTKLGRRFDSWEACSTLFRSPGPGAIKAFFEGTLEQLAHQDSPVVWMSDKEHGTSPTESQHFGVLAILQPFHLQVVATREEGSFLGINSVIRARSTPLGLGRDGIAWVPPSALDRTLRWHHVNTSNNAKTLFGPHYEDEKSKVLARINDYLAEVEAVEAAGAGNDEIAWYDVPEAERLEILRQHNVAARWTTVQAG